MKNEPMVCGLCEKEVHPLDAHMGRINGKLDVYHIDCLNKSLEKTIAETWEKQIKEEIKQTLYNGEEAKQTTFPDIKPFHGVIRWDAKA